MNILLINHYAGSRVHGMEYRPYYFAREWVRAGHHVTIVAATCAHVRTVAPNAQGFRTEEWVDGIRYVWLKTPAYRGNGIGRVRNIFSFVVGLSRSWRTVVGDQSPDVVIASSTYPLDIYPARQIARTSSAKLVFEVHDLWPLTLIELGGMSPRHPFIVLLHRAESTAYRTADRVISLLPKTRDYMGSRGMAPEKWRWIPNGVDPAEWSGPCAELPPQHREAIQAAKSRGSFLIGYAGGHGVSNGLHTMIDAARRLRSCPIEMLLVGQGPEKERLRRAAADTRAQFLPSVSKEMIPRLLREMDALYLGFRDEPLYRFGVCPNKLMDYLMGGKPVIYAINGHDDTVERARCGWTIPAEDAGALADAFVNMSNMRASEREEMGRRGQNYALEHHSYEVLARQFLNAVGRET